MTRNSRKGESVPEERLALHGGAGVIRLDTLSPEEVNARLEGMRSALKAGWRALKQGAPALEGVARAVCALEDHPAFNAGRGSVLCSDGGVELSASVMEGRERRAGAVFGLRRIRNPVLAARRLLEERQAFRSGAAVEQWLAGRGLETADPEWFVTRARREQMLRALRRGLAVLDHAGEQGTVGAVARDAEGNLAAATSTGGMTGQEPGRVGDCPLVGAGCYADSRSAAISATGSGEAFIRSVFCHELECAVRLAGMSLESACEAALKQVALLGGEGGCVAVDRLGNLLLPFNSAGMYRGWVDPRTGLYHLAVGPGEPHEFEGLAILERG